MFEIKHLKTLAAIRNSGSIRKAAEYLFTSQSALSHQVKELEGRVNAELFVRHSSPIQFTPAGQMMLSLANEVLPKVELTIHSLNGKIKNNTLSIAIKCHACFQWLLPVTNQLEQDLNGINIEFIDTPFTRNDEKLSPANILFTDELVSSPVYQHDHIGSFEVVAVVPKNHPLTQLDFLTAEHFIDQTLLTYPVATEQLDIFIHCLTPAQVSPKVIKHVKNSHVILQMVGAQMGIAVLPNWLVNTLALNSLVDVIPITANRLNKTMYMRTTKTDVSNDAIKILLPRIKKAFQQMV